jgi:ParB family chromosome partitioning protein
LPLSAEAAAEHKQLAEEYQTLFESAEEHDDETTEKLDAIEARIEELDDTETAYVPDVLALAGAIVTIGHDGELKVMRGKVRPEDEPGEDSRTVSSGKTRPDYSAVLVQRLTEAKSAAIGASLSERPDIALAAIVHCLATRCFDSHERGQSVQITASVTHYRQESDGAAALERAREQWAERIPGDEAALWDWCLTQPQETLLELLAFCAALTVNAVQGKQDRPDCERISHTDRLSVALGLDMKAWFTPNAANYFGHVSKPQILSAITVRPHARPSGAGTSSRSPNWPPWQSAKSRARAGFRNRCVSKPGREKGRRDPPLYFPCFRGEANPRLTKSAVGFA